MQYSDSLQAAHAELSTRLLAVSGRSEAAGVHAVGIGRKTVCGVVTETRAIRIYVTKKLPRAALSGYARIPASPDGIPTDVVEAPVAFASMNAGGAARTDQRRRPARPVVAGFSASHRDVATGTLGCFCRSIRQGDDPEDIFVLSNNHVFANLDRARPGDPLVQPGRSDGGRGAGSVFAEFVRAQPIVQDRNVSNMVDAALGRIVPGVGVVNEICGIGRVRGVQAAREGMTVRKHGRTTGLTVGRITDEKIDALIGLDRANPEVFTKFTGQMRIVPAEDSVFIAGPGDSGALVVAGDPPEAVGLLFASAPNGSYGYANHIADVFGALEVELL